MTTNNMPTIWFPNLGIEIFNLNRVAFSILGIDIYMYAICIMLGTIAGLSSAYYLAKKTNYDTEILFDVFVYAYFSALLGARLYYVIFEWDYYKNNFFEIFNIQNGGLAIYGGVIGAVLAIFLYTKIKKINFLQIIDFLGVGLAIGQSIGRWGNFFNREAYGGYTENIFAMRILKEEAQALTPNLLENLVVVNNIEYLQVHPTFLYESIWNFGNFILLLFFFKHKKFDGQIFCLYLLIYALGRFFIEGLRQDQLLLGDTNIAISQLLSLCFIILSLVFIYTNRNKANKPNNKL